MPWNRKYNIKTDPLIIGHCALFAYFFILNRFCPVVLSIITGGRGKNKIR